MANSNKIFKGNEKELADAIRKSDRVKYVETSLTTDERVLARVTDGIYRQPASALRELISNAYDADATRVILKTDAPRFQTISIEDDGHGMSPEALAHVVRHIGGSAKRSNTGADLGMTSKKDPTLSPGGRKLIGKIGIGLFSVSQLTHDFQIVSKVKGDSFRTIATVSMRQYSDDEFAADKKDNAEGFESAKAVMWREPASDREKHGTTITLTKIRREAIDTLRSRNMWNAIDETLGEDEYRALEPPKYHIGRVDSSGNLLKKTRKGEVDSLPWQRGDEPKVAFKKMVDCIWDELNHSNPSPELDRLFDYYLKMVLQLSLAIPIPYVERHLFDLPATEWLRLYTISNKSTGSAELVEPSAKATIRDTLKLTERSGDAKHFRVFMDDLELLRPIKYRGLPTTDHALKKPLVFIGKCRETFPKLPRDLSGGPLAFECYLFWTPKIAPKDHQGSLIRIHGASGTLFDPSFMRYQVSELTRLRQITCEIFVSEGLESALNIDRESFNNAHPHSVFIAKWLHSALRQLATAQKREANSVRHAVKELEKDSAIEAIKKIASSIWDLESDDSASSPPSVDLVDEIEPLQSSSMYQFSRSKLKSYSNRAKKTKDIILEEKLKAIIQILASYGLLESMQKKKRDQLASAIFEVLESSD